MRLIDSDELTTNVLTEDMMSDIWNDDVEACEAFLTLIKDAPTIDAVEVLRCKDCKYRLHLDATEHYPETYICRIDNISGTRKAYRDEWFCADGERRTDENDN